jgi:hypothetical protein
VADRWGRFCSQTMSRGPMMVDQSQARSTWCVSEPSLAFADGAASALSTVNTVQPRGSRCEDGKTNLQLTETKQWQHARARIQLWFAQRDAYSIDQKAIAHFFVKRPECPWVSLCYRGDRSRRGAAMFGLCHASLQVNQPTCPKSPCAELLMLYSEA